MSQFVLWFFGIPVAVALAIALGMMAEWLLWWAEDVTARYHTRFTGWRDWATQKTLHERDRTAFFQWLAAKAGTDHVTDAVDETIVEAQRQSELIHLLVEGEVPKAVSQCVQTHRLMAQITGACNMAEIQFEPECYALRARAVWLLHHTAQLVAHYPLTFEDPRLLHNSILLRKRALPTCKQCPYIQYPVEHLPDLCPTAQLFQPQGATHESR